MLSGIALMHADHGYSKRVNLYDFRSFAVWFQYIRQMAPASGSRGGGLSG